jgi:hypothetical protein
MANSLTSQPSGISGKAKATKKQKPGNHKSTSLMTFIASACFMPAACMVSAAFRGVVNGHTGRDIAVVMGAR